MTDKKVLLIIRDGYGHRDASQDNAVLLADTPFTDYLHETYPSCSLNTSGTAVGLPEGYMGGSEVGHLTIGAGRVVWQSLQKINNSIQSGEFFKKEAFKKVLTHAKEHNANVHLAGLLQNKGVHAHQDHLFACLRLAKQYGIASDKVHIHIFADGRDSPPRSLVSYVQTLQEQIDTIGVGTISTLIGRYFAMDRDTRWDRTKQAYELLVSGTGEQHDTISEAIKAAYAAGQDDEFITARRIGSYQGMQPGDSCIIYNYRTDRVRQLCKALFEDSFDSFTRQTHPTLSSAVMTSYYDAISAQVAFDTQVPKNILGEVIANQGLSQLRISETEKYPHVTFFFNGQRQEPFANEERVLISSPREVATYDQKPEMSIYEIKDRLLEQLASKKHSLVVVNYVNGDMVGHTGKLDAAIAAVQAVDTCVKETVTAAQEYGYDTVLFADHGNCEEMSGEHQTSHTLNMVDCLFIPHNKNAPLPTLRDGGLQDIAPTALTLLDIAIPSEMTGSSLFE